MLWETAHTKRQLHLAEKYQVDKVYDDFMKCLQILMWM